MEDVLQYNEVNEQAKHFFNKFQQSSFNFDNLVDNSNPSGLRVDNTDNQKLVFKDAFFEALSLPDYDGTMDTNQKATAMKDLTKATLENLSSSIGDKDIVMEVEKLPIKDILNPKIKKVRIVQADDNGRSEISLADLSTTGDSGEIEEAIYVLLDYVGDKVVLRHTAVQDGNKYFELIIEKSAENSYTIFKNASYNYDHSNPFTYENTEEKNSGFSEIWQNITYTLGSAIVEMTVPLYDDYDNFLHGLPNLDMMQSTQTLHPYSERGILSVSNKETQKNPSGEYKARIVDVPSNLYDDNGDNLDQDNTRLYLRKYYSAIKSA